jgi:FkbM family methyltransferase
MTTPLSELESELVGGLPFSAPPKWMSMLDRVRRKFGYRITLGAFICNKVLKHVPPTYDTEVVPGIFARLDFRQNVARFTWWSGRRYEAPTPQVIVNWLADAEKFFDVGANCGWFSYLALSSSKAEVHAFEPIPSLIEQMRATKSVNGLDRFHLHQMGVGDANEELRFHLIADETSYSTFGPHPDFVADPGVAVPVVTFDQWCEEEGLALPDRPSWVLKIDTEGFEAKALRGMKKALTAHAFLGIAIEMNAFCLEFCGSSIAEVEQLLNDAGYVNEPQRRKGNSLNQFFVPQ